MIINDQEVTLRGCNSSKVYYTGKTVTNNYGEECLILGQTTFFHIGSNGFKRYPQYLVQFPCGYRKCVLGSTLFGWTFKIIEKTH